MQIGTISVSIVAFVPALTAWPKASPQPVTPPSVSTFTIKISSVDHGVPLIFHGGPPLS